MAMTSVSTIAVDLACGHQVRIIVPNDGTNSATREAVRLIDQTIADYGRWGSKYCSLCTSAQLRQAA